MYFLSYLAILKKTDRGQKGIMDFIELYFGTNINTIIFIILNLVLIESLLSIDNAAALALMVRDLPPQQRGRALKYGILGAYFFRGVCLISSSFILKITWAKAIGGLYLLWIALNHFTKRTEAEELAAAANPEKGSFKTFSNNLHKKTMGVVGPFWATVILVEIMDLSFSVDNIFAAVAFTDKIGLICLGVFIGILAMRFVAQKFVVLLEKYPKLENAAFIVLILLGLKLILSYVSDLYKDSLLGIAINSHIADMIFSLITLFVFLYPIVTNIKWDKIFSKTESSNKEV